MDFLKIESALFMVAVIAFIFQVTSNSSKSAYCPLAMIDAKLVAMEALLDKNSPESNSVGQKNC